MKSSYLEECVLCCRDITIFAVGACDHPVCYECSTRMRVLCETNECPICRSNMPIVIFTHTLQAFASISKSFSLHNKKYQILFEDESISQSFELLLENKCQLCEEEFPAFEKLKEHMRRKHELHYCDLCIDNLKIFTFERKCYSRKDLARHKRVGDPIDTSHRGHPLCEFCDQRYIDLDDLYRHLRREHYFCHFCDADGRHQYYKNYDYLRVHFRKDHYLCEEDECASEKFIGAFRSEIDLKAHIAVHHSKNKSKAEARQARTLEFEFTYAPLNRPTGSSSPRGGRCAPHRTINVVEKNARKDNFKSSVQAEIENIDTKSTTDFPFLSEDAADKTNHSHSTNNHVNSLTLSYGRSSVPQSTSVEDFPALCSTAVAVTSEVSDNQSRKINFSINRQNNVPLRTSNVSIKVSQQRQPAQNYVLESKKSMKPDLETENSCDNSVTKAPKWISKKERFKLEDDFPKLEGRNVQPDRVATTNLSVSAFQNNTPSIVSLNKVEDNPSNTSDQFVVIKSKSKKKKQNRVNAWSDKPNSEKGEYDYNDSSDKSLSSLHSYSNLNFPDRDKDFKQNMVPPYVSSKSSHDFEDGNWVQKASFGKDDFPPLAPSEVIRRPPGFGAAKKKTPPPGFSTNPTASTNCTPLNISLSSIARQIVIPNQNKVNGATDASSDCFTKHMYIKPPNYDRRNDELIKRVSDLINAEGILYNEFKVMSRKFLQNEISAEEYHTKCLEFLGKKGFFEIFPELISLLPLISKQQELLAVHNKFLNSQKSSGAVSKNASMAQYRVVSCDVCYQVVASDDCKYHDAIHKGE